MNNKVTIYHTYKMAFTIPFDIKESNYIYNEIYFDLIIMDCLKTIVEEFTKNNLLSKKVKDNIKNYLLQARYYKDDKRKERIDIVNDILSSLNTQEKDNSITFYAAQLYLRRNSKRYLFSANTDEIKSEINNVHESIINDYLVLATHMNTILDEQFYENIFIEFVKSDIYYESLNVILDEMPQLFCDSIFYQRVMNVLSYKKFFNHQNNDKLEKRINKIIKKISKFEQV